jgi:hypothetical protein
LLSSPGIRLQPRPSQPSGNRIIPLRPPLALTDTSKNRPDLFPLPHTKVTFKSSLKEFSKSSVILDLSTSSTVDSNQATHREPSNIVPEKPFLFSTTLRTSDLFATEKRNDFASTKNELSIPNYQQQPQRGIASSLAPTFLTWLIGPPDLLSKSGNKSPLGRERKRVLGERRERFLKRSAKVPRFLERPNPSPNCFKISVHFFSQTCQLGSQIVTKTIVFYITPYAALPTALLVV